MKTDLKYLFKDFRLSNTQKRLFNSISREPTAHLYSQDYMIRNQLTRGGVASALRRLKALNLVAQEDGVWQISPPEMRAWYLAVGENPDLADKLRCVELEDPYFWNPVLKSVYKRCIEVFGDKDKARRWMRSPILALGCQAPLDFLDTAEGVELVMDTLVGIEYGAFS
jgi:Protein of unknown function (DUF2384)